MPPKKRDPESDTPTQAKRRKKKKDEFDEDSEDEVENNGHDAATLYEEPENTIDIVRFRGLTVTSKPEKILISQYLCPVCNFSELRKFKIDNANRTTAVRIRILIRTTVVPMRILIRMTAIISALS